MCCFYLFKFFNFFFMSSHFFSSLASFLKLLYFFYRVLAYIMNIFHFDVYILSSQNTGFPPTTGIVGMVLVCRVTLESFHVKTPKDFQNFHPTDFAQKRGKTFFHCIFGSINLHFPFGSDFTISEFRSYLHFPDFWPTRFTSIFQDFL
jgi:hypothetical protein